MHLFNALTLERQRLKQIVQRGLAEIDAAEQELARLITGADGYRLQGDCLVNTPPGDSIPGPT